MKKKIVVITLLLIFVFFLSSQDFKNDKDALQFTSKQDKAMYFGLWKVSESTATDYDNLLTEFKKLNLDFEMYMKITENKIIGYVVLTNNSKTYIISDISGEQTSVETVYKDNILYDDCDLEGQYFFLKKDFSKVKVLTESYYTICSKVEINILDNFEIVKLEDLMQKIKKQEN